MVPKIAISSQNSPFYSKIMWLWLVIQMLIRFYGCKNAIFYGFCWFFAYFLWEKGPKNFSGSKNFFSRKFDPKWFHIHLFELPNSFWPIMLYCLVTLKKSFFPIFPNKLGSSQKVGFRNPGGQWCSPMKLSKSFQIWTLGVLRVPKKQSNLKLQNCHDNLQHWPD